MTAAKPLLSIDFAGEHFLDLSLNAMQASIFPLVVEEAAGRLRCIGTCFAISNQGLCLTARHVIDEIGDTATADGSHQLRHALHLLYVNEGMDAPDDGDLFGGLIPLVNAVVIDGIDIAVLHFNLPAHVDTGDRVPFPASRLRLRPPVTGEAIFAFGYRQGVWESNDAGALSLAQTFSASRGQVGQVHLTGRDRIMMPMPCFETSARFDAGMSGGPIIGPDGLVIGLVTSSFDLLDPAAPPLSYGSPIAPAMVMTVPTMAPDGTATRRFLWDFVDGGSVPADQTGIVATRSATSLSISLGNGMTVTSTLGA